MKTVLAFSVVSFLLIFGGVVLTTQHLQGALGPAAEGPQLDEADDAAADRLLADLALERDRIQVEKERLADLGRQVGGQQKLLAEARENLERVVADLRAEQSVLVEEKERSARRLAKMYEAMKPDKAAPILASLDLDIVLEIMTRMKERPAAKIMSHLDAGLAAEISAQMSPRGAP